MQLDFFVQNKLSVYSQLLQLPYLIAPDYINATIVDLIVKQIQLYQKMGRQVQQPHCCLEHYIELVSVQLHIACDDSFMIIGVQSLYTYVTQHEKIGLMCTKYTPSYYSICLTFCTCYSKSVTCVKQPIVSCMPGKNVSVKLCLIMKLCNFKF